MNRWVIDDLVPGAFMEFKRGVHKGTWKILDVRKLSDGDGFFYRIKIDQDLDTPGDELIIEWHLDEQLVAYVFSTFEQFDKKDAESWPPPFSITLGEDKDAVDYESMDEDGFLAWDDYNTEISHFEYSDKEEKAFLQIYNENGTITMFVGYSIQVAFIALI